MIFGATGSGKTTLGRRLGAALGVPVIELDSLYHQPNWQPTPDDAFRRNVLAAIDRAADGWVTDGNYRVIREILLPRADTVLWLRLPWRVSYWRMCKRTVRRAWTKEELWNTNRESWRLSFLSRDSLLLWGIHHWRAHHRNVRHDLATIPHQADVIELRSDADVDTFVAALHRSPSP